VNILALARLNAVTLTCLLCFLLRAIDLALPSHWYVRTTGLASTTTILN
jgi:hypothetical protein